MNPLSQNDSSYLSYILSYFLVAIIFQLHWETGVALFIVLFSVRAFIAAGIYASGFKLSVKFTDSDIIPYSDKIITRFIMAIILFYNSGSVLLSMSFLVLESFIEESLHMTSCKAKNTPYKDHLSTIKAKILQKI